MKIFSSAFIRNASKAIFVLSLPVLTACGGGSTTTAVESDTTTTDTVETPVVTVPERLPDTTYVSAQRVWYNIENPDTTVSGELASLADLYAGQPSIMTFRGGPYRQANYGAELDTVPSRIEVVWRAETASDIKGTWGGGSGWTGQPLYIEWPDSLADLLRKKHAVGPQFKGREIIVGSLCGKVYFFNPDNGEHTRPPLNETNPIKGTVSFDPTFNGYLYIGQGIAHTRPFGTVTVDLFTNTVIDRFGEDPRALRHWGAYDSSAIRVGQFLFRPGENGSVYKYLITPDGPKMRSILRYKVNGAAPGIESSMAVYANYGVVADNHGNVVCINLDNMRPVWCYTLGDDTDASPMIIAEDNGVFVYVGCEIDRNSRGHSVFAKLNMADGEEVWKIQPEGRQRIANEKHFDGGFYASPLPGHGDCSDLIFTNFVKNTSGANGEFMAIDRNTGTIAYTVPLKYYSWSSPVGFLTKDGKQIVFTGDGAGNMYLIEGKTGNIIATERVGHNFESSPIAVGNSVFVGSRTNGIFRVDIL